MKPRKCKECTVLFTPARPLQFLCSPLCAIAYSKKQSEKNAKKELNEKIKGWKVSAYSKEHKADLQREINKLARKIDSKFNLPCIDDCGRPYGKQIDGCHYHSRGSNSSLRFHLANIHSGDSQCNNFSAEHKTGYKRGLEKRYGKEYIEMVENLPLKYKEIKLNANEVVEKLKIVRKLLRDFDTFDLINGKQAREMFNTVIGIYI